MNRSYPIALLIAAAVFFFVTERLVKYIHWNNEGPTTIMFWASSIQAQTMLQLKTAFEEQNPGILVEVQTVPWESLQQKTLWAVAAGSNVPDVIVGSSEWMGGLVSNGALDPLNAYLDDTILRNYFPQTLGIYQFPEIFRDQPTRRGEMRQYGLPLDLDLMMVFYRADILDPLMNVLGMKSFPDLWSDFLKLGMALRARMGSGRQVPHLLYLDPDDPILMRMAFLPASKAKLLSDDFTRAEFDSVNACLAFGFFRDLIRRGPAIRWERATMEDPLILYKTGRALLNITGPWYSKMLENKLPEQAGKWRVALFPRRVPDSPTCGLGGACLAMPYNAPHKPEAIRLIRFMAADRFALAYFNRVGSPPPQITAWNDAAFDAPVPYYGGQKIYHVVRQAIETATPLQLLPDSEIAKGPLRWAMHEISILDAPLTRTLENAVKWSNSIIDKD